MLTLPIVAKKRGKVPKTKCCVSKPRCSRCPIQLLKDGALPEGYQVKKRRLMKANNAGELVRVKKPKKSDFAA